MFAHVLLPTDGSQLSEDAIRKGVQLARSMKARVTGLCVVPKPRYYSYDSEIPADIKEKAEKQYRAAAQAHLEFIRKAAEEAGVACQLVSSTDDQPYEAIIRTAEAQGCDLIMMASHGRRGVKAVLLGSETQKVLTHSKTPVLVFR
ncbi:MAG: universal stress protein [Desulfobacterales bacterium]|jgi:nucleotide-binding universal stress UspA family protein|nr:universal stress protein [Desulfobacterales bacterium]